MRDLVVLFLHLIVSIVRLIRPGGARSIVAESVLVKQQLLILNRSRKRSPNLCASDRIVAGLCGLLIHPVRLMRCAIILKPSTPELPPGAEEPKVPLVVLSQAAEKAGTKRTRPGSHCSGCGNEATQSDLGLPSNRSTDRVSFRY
jgi:hypothetical protein